jgi:hypothetical protein
MKARACQPHNRTSGTMRLMINFFKKSIFVFVFLALAAVGIHNVTFSAAAQALCVGIFSVAFARSYLDLYLRASKSSKPAADFLLISAPLLVLVALLAWIQTPDWGGAIGISLLIGVATVSLAYTTARLNGDMSNPSLLTRYAHVLILVSGFLSCLVFLFGFGLFGFSAAKSGLVYYLASLSLINCFDLSPKPAKI